MEPNRTTASQFDLRRIGAETFVERIEFHRSLPSTNDRGLELAGGDEMEVPLLILSERQTAGRGRGPNGWWSAPGALTFSLILEAGPRKTACEQAVAPTQVSLSAGLAVCEALCDLLPGREVGLKWPNDVFLQRRKVCGILAEGALNAECETLRIPHSAFRTQRLVLGIGINVNNSLAAGPAELQASATSLVDVTGRQHDVTDVLVRVLQHTEDGVRRLASGQTNLPGRFSRFCLLQGRSVHLQIGSQQATGTCRGIDAEGALVLETETGPQRFVSGVVTHFD